MTECTRPTIGGFYRHFKNKLYQVLNIAVHADTEEELVIYQALYGDFKVYARPLKDFMSEVDHDKYPNAMQKMRFVKVTLRKADEVQLPVEEEAVKPKAIVKPEPDELPEKLAEEPIKESFKEDVKAEESYINGVHPLLLKFLDAENVEGRLEVFKEMQEVADQHMLGAVAASLDIPLSGTMSIDEAYELIFDNLITQKRYESVRWR